MPFPRHFGLNYNNPSRGGVIKIFLFQNVTLNSNCRIKKKVFTIQLSFLWFLTPSFKRFFGFSSLFICTAQLAVPILVLIHFIDTHFIDTQFIDTHFIDTHFIDNSFHRQLISQTLISQTLISQTTYFIDNSFHRHSFHRHSFHRHSFHRQLISQTLISKTSQKGIHR